MEYYKEIQIMTKVIPLTQGQVALVSDIDYEWLNQWKWTAQKHGNRFYAMTHSEGGRTSRLRLLMHRVIMDAPDGIAVDHIDNDGLNNVRENLRLATHQQNCFNKPAPRSNTSGFKGVSWSKTFDCWVANIKRDDLKFQLGHFNTPEEAALAYDAAARELFGEYAYLNFPEMDAPHSRPRPRKQGPAPKITDAQVAEIRSLANQGVKHRVIAERFGITPQYVSQLQRGQWRKGEVQS